MEGQSGGQGGRGCTQPRERQPSCSLWEGPVRGLGRKDLRHPLHGHRCACEKVTQGTQESKSAGCSSHWYAGAKFSFFELQSPTAETGIMLPSLSEASWGPNDLKWASQICQGLSVISVCRLPCFLRQMDLEALLEIQTFSCFCYCFVCLF